MTDPTWSQEGVCKMIIIRCYILLAVVIYGLSATAPSTTAAHPLSFAPLVQEQQDKIVHIKTKDDDQLERGQRPPESFRPYQPPEFYHGMGSGFIIESNGMIVTNFHVVKDAKVIEVVLNDDSTYRAELIGSDERTDLAVIRIDAAVRT